MPSLRFISPGEIQGQKGGGPEDDPRYPRSGLQAYGLTTLAFGVALGLTFMLFFGIFRSLGTPIAALQEFVSATPLATNLLLSFLYGFVGGLSIAAIYNLITLRRLNLFGIEGTLD